MLNVLVACKEPREPGGLRCARADEQRILYDTSYGWSNASNNLLDKAAALGGDALFIDDDTELTPGCLDHVFSYYDRASLFGLDLHDMSGARQAGARHTMSLDGGLHDWVQPGPAYVAHCSTSAMYIKAEALAVLRFPVWAGVHWEDVAFCLDAWLHGLRVMAVPGRANHAIEGGVGATKRHTPEFWAKWHTNRNALVSWCNERGVGAALAQGVIPVEVREL